MNDKTDLERLAREYLDLWEDQLTAMASDPDMARQSARFFDALGSFGAQANALFAANLATLARTATGQPDDRDPGTDTPAGTPAPSAAPDDRDDRLDQLARRVGELEKRIGELESGARAAGRKTSGRTRKKPAAGS